MALEEAEVALHALFKSKSCTASDDAAGILKSVEGQLDRLSPSTQRKLQVLVLEEKLQEGSFDEDVIGLVEGLFSADGPEHEQLHLAVRIQAVLSIIKGVYSSKDVGIVELAKELLCEPPEKCQNRSLCNSLAALHSETELLCVEFHKRTGLVASQDNSLQSALQALWSECSLSCAKQLLQAALKAEREQLTANSSAAEDASSVPLVNAGKDAAGQEAPATQIETGAEIKGSTPATHGMASQSTPTEQVAHVAHSTSEQDDIICAQQRPSSSPRSDSDIDIGGTPPVLPPPMVRLDWATLSNSAEARQGTQEAHMGCEHGLVRPHASQSALEQMALVPDTYEDLGDAQQVATMHQRVACAAEVPDSNDTETESVENNSLHSNGGLRLSGSLDRPDSHQAKHASNSQSLSQASKPASQQVKRALDSLGSGQAGKPSSKQLQHTSEEREPAWTDSAAQQDMLYSSPVDRTCSQPEQPTAKKKGPAIASKTDSPQDTPYSSPTEVLVDQAAPDQAPQGFPSAAAADGGRGCHSDDEVFEDAAETAQTLLDLKAQPRDKPDSALAWASAGNGSLQAQEGVLYDGHAQRKTAAESSGELPYDVSILQNVTDAQQHTSFGSAPLFTIPVEDPELEDIVDLTSNDKEDIAGRQQPDLARMIITQKPAAMAQPRRRQDRHRSTSGAAHLTADPGIVPSTAQPRITHPAAQPPSAPSTARASNAYVPAQSSLPQQDGIPERTQKSSATTSVRQQDARKPRIIPEEVPWRKIARKQTAASAGSKSAAAAPSCATSSGQQIQNSSTAAGATPASAAASAAQWGSHCKDAVPHLLSMLEQPRPAAFAQEPSVAGTKAGKIHQHTASFDQAAASCSTLPCQTPSASARPDQAKQAAHSYAMPASASAPSTVAATAAMRTQTEAQRQGLAQGVGLGRLGTPGQAAGRSETPGQVPGILGKRAAEPSTSPPAKRTKQSSGSLLGIANMVIRDFARRRLGGAAGTSSARASAPPAIPALPAASAAAALPVRAASPAASTPAAAATAATTTAGASTPAASSTAVPSAAAATTCAVATPTTLHTASMRAVVEAAMSNPGFVTVPTLVPKRFRKANARANAAIRRIRAQSPLPASSSGMRTASSGLTQPAQGISLQPSSNVPFLSNQYPRDQHLRFSWQPEQAAQQRGSSSGIAQEQPSSRLHSESGPRPISARVAGTQHEDMFYETCERMSPQDYQRVSGSAWQQQVAQHSRDPLAPPQAGPAEQHAFPSRPPESAESYRYVQLPFRSTLDGRAASLAPPAFEQWPQAHALRSSSSTGCGDQQESCPAAYSENGMAGQHMQAAQQLLATSAAPDQAVQRRQHSAYPGAAHPASGHPTTATHSNVQQGPMHGHQTCPSVLQSGAFAGPGLQGTVYSTTQAGGPGMARLAPQQFPNQPRRLSDPTMVWNAPIQTMQDKPRPGTSPTVMWNGYNRPYTGHGGQ